jgi:hypothetical protein
VTRRRGTFWYRVLKVGDLVCGVEKQQGIKKGGLVRLGVIRIVSLRVEQLDAPLQEWYEDGDGEAAREGFPELVWGAFVQMFVRHMGGDHRQILTRIEFEYVDEPAAV